MRKILIIDDDVIFLKQLERYVEKHYPGLEVTSFTDPVQGLAAITTDLALLLIDLEMPGVDGVKILAFAAGKGLSRSRVVILSAREADYLHRLFPMGSCLAVLNKYERKQQAALEMILNSLQRKCASCLTP